MFVCCKCCVLSGRGFCDELIARPEESYRLLCVVVCDLENLKNEEAMPRVGSQRHKKKIERTTCWKVKLSLHQLLLRSRRYKSVPAAILENLRGWGNRAVSILWIMVRNVRWLSRVGLERFLELGGTSGECSRKSCCRLQWKGGQPLPSKPSRKPPSTPAAIQLFGSIE